MGQQENKKVNGIAHFICTIFWSILVLSSCIAQKNVISVTKKEYKYSEGKLILVLKNSSPNEIIVSTAVNSGLNEDFLQTNLKCSNFVFYTLQNTKSLNDTIFYYPFYSDSQISKITALSSKKSLSIEINWNDFFNWNDFLALHSNDNIWVRIRIYYFENDEWRSLDLKYEVMKMNSK